MSKDTSPQPSSTNKPLTTTGPLTATGGVAAVAGRGFAEADNLHSAVAGRGFAEAANLHSEADNPHTAVAGEALPQQSSHTPAMGVAAVAGEALPQQPSLYTIGIDLGTTNSVIAFSRIDSSSKVLSPVEILPIPQIVAPSMVESKSTLPSFLFLSSEAENQNAGSYDLPWARDRHYVAGAYARQQSAENPTQTVAAAKSWLGYSRVDRNEAILPWGSQDPELKKISPVAASQIYLEHLASTWNQAFPESPILDQQVVLTVPASFDASARELTRQAALNAGLPQDLILLEEPQAAFYAWLSNQGEAWRKMLHEGDKLLVCDVGGGTTDFSLIEVGAENGELLLKRQAVGNHLLVGGDNMDLSLALLAQKTFEEKGIAIDAWQSIGLWHACRAAKETLLSGQGPENYPVSILGKGRRLVGGTVSTELNQKAVSEVLVEGFFPMCELNAKPSRLRGSGFKALGLPFETDAAITRHLADFLSRQGVENSQSSSRPTHVLFNGGVLKSTALRQRLLEVLKHWFQTSEQNNEIQLLEGNTDLDFAVARGAAYYGAMKITGKGTRIRGGAARSYYLGVETAGPAVPGAVRPVQAVCVVPFGMEEGTELEVPGEEVGLVVGESVKFRFFSSASRQEDQPGQSLTRWDSEEVQETDSLEALLPASTQHAESDYYIPVKLKAKLTELGVLEVWGVSTVSDEKWKLEFSVRED